MSASATPPTLSPTQELILILEDALRETPDAPAHYVASWQEDLEALKSGRAIAVKTQVGYLVEELH